MAHSHQNTLLSRLGFADPDRSDPKHTLACEYLCKQDVGVKVGMALGYGVKPMADGPESLGTISFDGSNSWIVSVKGRTEIPIMKGGYYVGFADVVLQIELSTAKCGNRTRPVLIEVKARRCDPADVVKQIKLYRQYTLGEYYALYAVVATCYPVSQSTKDMFKREGIHHIYLGAGFEAYCAERRAEQPVSEEGL